VGYSAAPLSREGRADADRKRRLASSMPAVADLAGAPRAKSKPPQHSGEIEKGQAIYAGLPLSLQIPSVRSRISRKSCQLAQPWDRHLREDRSFASPSALWRSSMDIDSPSRMTCGH
jgi:hypothetical protein